MSAGIEFYIKIRDLTQGAFDKVKQNTLKLQGSVKGAGLSIAELNGRIKQLQRTRNLMPPSSLSQIRALNREIKKLSREMERLKTTNGSWIAAKFGKAFRALPGFVANPIMLAGSAMAKSFTMAKERSAQRTALHFATDGKGEEAIDSVKQINDELGLSNQSGLEGFKTLAASVRSFNQPLEKTLEIYKSMGMAASAMKADGEAQEGIFRALGQMASKSAVSAEEWHGEAWRGAKAKLFWQKRLVVCGT